MTLRATAASILAGLLIPSPVPASVPVTSHCHTAAQWEHVDTDENPDVRVTAWHNLGSQGVFMTCWEAWDRRKTSAQVVLTLAEFNNGSNVTHSATARAANVVTLIWRTSASGARVNGQAVVGRWAAFTEARP